MTPGEQVHVRIAIADTLDGQLDSTVLMRTGGLGFTDAPLTDPCTTTGGTCALPADPSASATSSAGSSSGATISTDPAEEAAPSSSSDVITAPAATAADAVARAPGRRGLARTGAPTAAWALGALTLVGGGLLLIRRRREG